VKTAFFGLFVLMCCRLSANRAAPGRSTGVFSFRRYHQCRLRLCARRTGLGGVLQTKLMEQDVRFPIRQCQLLASGRHAPADSRAAEMRSICQSNPKSHSGISAMTAWRALPIAANASNLVRRSTCRRRRRRASSWRRGCAFRPLRARLSEQFRRLCYTTTTPTYTRGWLRTKSCLWWPCLPEWHRSYTPNLVHPMEFTPDENSGQPLLMAISGHR